MKASIPNSVPIDESGPVAHFRADNPFAVRTVALHIDADKTASYRVDFGAIHTDDGEVQFFNGDEEYQYKSTNSVTDGWSQPEEFARLVVTEPASIPGATADVYLAEA